MFKAFSALKNEAAKLEKGWNADACYGILPDSCGEKEICIEVGKI